MGIRERTASSLVGQHFHLGVQARVDIVGVESPDRVVVRAESGYQWTNALELVGNVAAHDDTCAVCRLEKLVGVAAVGAHSAMNCLWVACGMLQPPTGGTLPEMEFLAVDCLGMRPLENCHMVIAPINSHAAALELRGSNLETPGCDWRVDLGTYEITVMEDVLEILVALRSALRERGRGLVVPSAYEASAVAIARAQRGSAGNADLLLVYTRVGQRVVTTATRVASVKAAYDWASAQVWGPADECRLYQIEAERATVLLSTAHLTAYPAFFEVARPEYYPPRVAEELAEYRQTAGGQPVTDEEVA